MASARHLQHAASIPRTVVEKRLDSMWRQKMQEVIFLQNREIELGVYFSKKNEFWPRPCVCEMYLQIVDLRMKSHKGNLFLPL